MAQFLALLFLLKKLMLKELGSLSSVRFNNFLFCILFIMSARGGGPKAVDDNVSAPAQCVEHRRRVR